MRHKRGNRKLGKPTDQRIALLRSLSYSLFKHQRIMTTVTRAKEAEKYIERIIALIKKGDLASDRQAIALLPHKDIIKNQVKPLAEVYADRPGGFTRIIPLPRRKGDNAPMGYLTLV